MANYKITKEDTLIAMELIDHFNNDLTTDAERTAYSMQLKNKLSGDAGEARWNLFSSMLNPTGGDSGGLVDSTATDPSNVDVSEKIYQPIPFNTSQLDSAVTAYEGATGEKVTTEEMGIFSKAIEDRTLAQVKKQNFDNASNLVASLESSAEFSKYKEYSDLEMELSQYGSRDGISSMLLDDPRIEKDSSMSRGEIGMGTEYKYSSAFLRSNLNPLSGPMQFEDYKRFFLNGKENYIHSDSNLSNSKEELRSLYASMGYDLNESQIDSIIQNPENISKVQMSAWNTASEYDRNALKSVANSLSNQYNTLSEVFSEKIDKWENMSKDYVVYPGSPEYNSIVQEYNVNPGTPIPVGFAKKHVDAIWNKYASEQQYLSLIGDEIEDVPKLRQEGTYGAPEGKRDLKPRNILTDKPLY